MANTMKGAKVGDIWRTSYSQASMTYLITAIERFNTKSIFSTKILKTDNMNSFYKVNNVLTIVSDDGFGRRSRLMARASNLAKALYEDL